MEKILLSKYQEMDETERRKVKELLKDKHKYEYIAFAFIFVI